MENHQEINIQELIEKGRSKGSLSSSEILEAFPEENLDIETIDKIYEELENNGIEINYLDEEPVDLEVVLPESLKGDLEEFVANELAKTLKGGVEASFSKKVAGGFNIGPKNGGYFVSFTDETFNALISEYLRPATKKILFG